MAGSRGEHCHNRRLGGWKIKPYQRNARVSTLHYVDELCVYQDIFKRLTQWKYYWKTLSIVAELFRENTERSESGKLHLYDSMWENKIGKGNKLLPGFSISDIRLLHFRISAFRFLAHCLLFEFWAHFVFKSGYSLQSVFTSVSLPPILHRFGRAICKSKFYEVLKLFSDLSFK